MLRTPALSLLVALTTALPAQEPLDNKTIWGSSTFSAEYVGGLASMKDGQTYTALEQEKDATMIVQYAYKTGNKVATLVNSTDLVPAGSRTPIDLEGYSFSGDEKKMMLQTATEPIYRYSFYAHHYVYDRTTKALVPLSDPKKAKQRLATFSPDGSHAAFVRDNNLFLVDLASMTEIPVTKDGEWNKVLNGATDWVTEEEFALVQGYAWSPNGTKLLYLRTDESKVHEFDLTTYKGELYPGEYRFKYPKAGEANGELQLWVYDTRDGRTTQVPLGDGEGEPYIPRFGWTMNDDVLWFMHMDRLQNQKDIYTVAVPQLRAVQAGLKPVRIYHETSKTYIEVTDDLFFLKDGTGFILTSEQSGWNAILWCNMAGTAQRPVAIGEYDVVAVKGVDEANKRVIFTAALKGANQQEVWSIGLNGKGLKQLSPAGGTNDAEFSEGFKYFINTHSTANTPPVITLHEGSGRLVKTLKDNSKLAGALRRYGWQPIEPITAEVSPGLALNGWMLKPPGFESRKRYPVMMTQYSGPNSNEAMDQWDGRGALWNQMLAQKGYIVVCFDPRGTGHRGRDFRHITYGQLGKYETEDQIAAARWLAQQPYVDGARIGIWGWSYGGYMSSLCITKGADVFKMAIAVAPVTNWRYYDSIYTERYMGLPADNAKGYDDNSPINHVDKLKGRFLLIHGMADDNVHLQNSTEMVNALIKANKQFEQFFYPDKNHGIHGGNTRVHLYDLMTDFIVRNL